MKINDWKRTNAIKADELDSLKYRALNMRENEHKTKLASGHCDVLTFSKCESKTFESVKESSTDPIY